MKTIHGTILFLALALVSNNINAAEPEHNWQLDVGFRFFKTSSTGKPAEIGYNAVFDRWEDIHQNQDAYTVDKYQALESLWFNLNFGVDLFARWRKYLLLKLGYDYTNPAGIGGTGRISYTNADGVSIQEKKNFSYTSHQLNLFIGPIVPIKDRAEIYLAFAPFAPTWVTYKERYQRTEDGAVTEKYDKVFKGFFGNCRALVGVQVEVYKGLKLGSELIFAFFNYSKLTSGDLEDYSFQFPAMKWNFTIRYQIF